MSRRPRSTSIQELGPARVAEFLAKATFFREFDPEVANKITPHLEVEDFAEGEALVSLDPSGIGLGFLASGRASVSVPGPRGLLTALFDLKVGDCFNEVAVLSGRKSRFIVTALETCRVLEIGGAALEQLIVKVPSFSTSLAKMLATRMDAASSVLAKAPVSAAAAEPDTGKMAFVSIHHFPKIESVLDLVPRQLIHQFRLLPLEVTGSTLTVGFVDPFDHSATRELTRVLHAMTPKIVAISADDFTQAVRKYRLDTPGSSSRGAAIPASSLLFDEHESERPEAMRASGEQVVKLAAEVVAAGLERHASDIHLEQDRSGVRVRFRVNGTIGDWGVEVPSYMGKALVARFKVLGGLDITEKRRPQDGRVGVRVGTRDVDLRVSTLPSSDGEKLVMRVFEAAQMLQGLDQIFSEKRTLDAIRTAIERPYGAIVVAGPTGSGKSSTLYSALSERRRARADTNILTVEDPVEYRLQGVTQVQVNPAIDLGFAPILRAMLRQDPDVVMVGEIRDSETAHLALEAAMTGHLMLTSIHANDAASVIQRFENLGCNRSEVAQSLALVLVQRLARRLCPHCTKNGPAPSILIETLESRRLFDRANPVKLPYAEGCKACDQTGLAGRVAVVESLVIDDELRAMLMAEQPLSEIIAHASSSGGMIRFYRYARHLMQHGLLSPAEALLSVAS